MTDTRSKKPWEADWSDGPGNGQGAGPSETDPLIQKEAPSWTSTCDLGILRFLGDLETHFGYKLLCLIAAVQHLQKGFCVALVSKAEPYIYKSLSVPAPQMQIYQGITQLPWALKPVIGLMSDIFPIGGYRKVPYLWASSTVCLCSWIFIGGFSQRLPPSAVLLFVCALFLSELNISTGDLLSEAKYAERMRTCPEHGTGLITYVWFGLYAAGLVASASSGPVINRLGPQACYTICIVPLLITLVVLSKGCLEDKHLSEEEVVKVRERFYKQREAIFLSVLMLFGSVALIVCAAVFSSPYVNGAVAILVALIMLASFSLVLSPIIARFNAWCLLQTSMGLSVSGASFYFYTDTVAQYPEGPNFSPFFYNTVMSTVSSVLSLAAIACYQRYMSKWRYRHLMLLTNVAYSLLCIPDVIFFARLNKGIVNDHLFVLGTASMQQIIWQWQWIPQVVLLSFLCPKGMEATMYALLAGCHNLGNTIASQCGAMLLDSLGVRPSGAPAESAQFKNLWMASAISTFMPCITIIALFWLIPDKRQDEPIYPEDSQHDATEGSLWRTWRGLSSRSELREEPHAA